MSWTDVCAVATPARSCERKGVWAQNRQMECGAMSGMFSEGGYLERRGVFYKVAFELVPM